jgi:hypothetical protein
MHHLKHILTTTILGLFLTSPANSSVSPDGMWSNVLSRNLEQKEFNYRSVNANTEELVNQLKNAPLEGSSDSGLEIFLPLPDGKFERVSAFESPIMTPELAAKLPHIKTYKVTGLDNPEISGRLDASPKGFHGFLNTDQGVVYIEPELSYNQNASSGAFRSFKKSNFPSSKEGYKCSVISHNHSDNPLQSLSQSRPQASSMRSSGTTIRTYRLALAATAEYTAAVSSGPPTVEKGQAAIVTAVNRINAIYEKEVAIKFVLVDNSNIVFTNTLTDGYTNSNGGILLSENQNKLDNVITPEEYDIGHVFSTGGGGVAVLASVCDDANDSSPSSNNKAKGVTGLGNPVGDPFVVDYVSHEIGHQFGAPHTFNAGGISSGACDDTNRENHVSTDGGTQLSDSAYEPGSGSTIMAYAGICAPQNIQNNSDPYFHARSLEQIREFVENEISFSNTQGGSCGTSVLTGNTAPSADAGSNYTIPANTPFALTGSGDDVDAADVASLNYTWEQFDLGTKTTSKSDMHTDADTRPIVRSRQGTGSSTRYIPALDAILESNLTKYDGERLPTEDRDMTFRLTVRSGSSGFNQDDMTVTVDKDAGPFAVTAPAGGITLSGGSEISITWNVANTQTAPVNCTNVNIKYSNDSGQNFSTTLSESTENDGTESVTLPNETTSTGRIKVQCLNNVFFNVSAADFSINGVSFLAITADSADKAEGNSGSTDYTFSVTRSGNTSGTASVTYSVTGLGDDPATAADFIGDTLPSGSVDFTDGESNKTININVAGDTDLESDESFTVVLSNPVSSSISSTSANGVIRNDDSSLSILATDADKAEGNSESTDYTFSVTRSGDISGTASVTYSVTGLGDDPATAADFIGDTLPSGSVDFTDGESNKTITVNVAGDTDLESDESFTVVLSNPVSSSISSTSANGVMRNDDSSLSILASDTDKAEGNSGSTDYTFSVTRSGDTSGTASVTYSVTGLGDDPATAADFIGDTLTSGSVDFADGESSKTITINVAGDTDLESDESFTVVLSNPVSSSISSASANAIIENDDTDSNTGQESSSSSGGGSGGLLVWLLLPLLLMRRKLS